ncbi:HAD hydrolase-like protein [bacterium]|nr:HAD hydrolase-like protein [bacterium]
MMVKKFPEIKLLVYDMDGTLVDAFVDIQTGVNNVLAQFGLPPRTYEEVRRGVGEGARNLIKRMVPPGADVDADALYVAYRTYYAEHPIVRAGLYPGVGETLDKLKARGIKQAILTNKPDEVARPICDKLDLTRRIDGIWGEIDGEASKPDAEAILAIVKHFGLQPHECAMVGDGRPDCAVAKAAGTKLFGVAWGQLTKEELEEQQADTILERFDELNSLI